MEPPDFRRCPSCGDELEVATEEKLYGANHLQITVDDTGDLVGAKWGLTEPHWDSVVTTRYCCDACGETLPESFQLILDDILENSREPDEVS